MPRKSTSSENERLDDNNIKKVIDLLECEKPITKKAACELLNISYNTTRLSAIIQKYKDKKETDKKLRAQKRGKPLQPDEIKYIVSSYLEGTSVEHIANALHRPSTVVVNALDNYHVPRRNKKYDYFKPGLIPDDAVRTVFKAGEKVYSTRYDSLCVIEQEVQYKPERVYRIWLLSERWHQYAYQPASELASLEHLKEYLWATNMKN